MGTVNRRFFGTKGDQVLSVLFLIAIFLGIWTIGIYRETIVENKYLIGFILGGGTLGVLGLSVIGKNSLPKSLIFLVRVVIGSVFLSAAILSLNKQFGDQETKELKCEIVGKGSLAAGKSGCQQPYVMIRFEETEKQLVFYCHEEELVTRARSVVLKYSRGLFGFYVFKATELAE
ncbi:hypothetical protein LZZ85_15605 [Terrimonas sp. NA20]|uniref:Uncharacterized protein n=1 Tax=Terrimonas ginsenosidimutans TaxID=2908004 RepID=A0ABS9KTS0_9BACT|nr:hypothetical protein [Terrimonas ginsenosidimutans]MCG2615725.1 hypothetical protein [Terrimonas ginsenosidimutans]